MKEKQTVEVTIRVQRHDGLSDQLLVLFGVCRTPPRRLPRSIIREDVYDSLR